MEWRKDNFALPVGTDKKKKRQKPVCYFVEVEKKMAKGDIDVGLHWEK